jgi:ribosomal protein S4
VNGRKISKPSYMTSILEAGVISYSKTIDIDAGVQKEVKEEVKKHSVIEHEREIKSQEPQEEDLEE